MIEGLYKKNYIIIYNSIPRQTGDRLVMKWGQIGYEMGQIGYEMGQIGGIMGQGIDICRYL